MSKNKFAIIVGAIGFSMWLAISIFFEFHISIVTGAFLIFTIGFLAIGIITYKAFWGGWKSSLLE